MKWLITHLALYALAALEILLGVVAGMAALVSLITEGAARVAVSGNERFARRTGLTPVSPRLRTEMANVLSGIANPAAGGTR